MPLRYLLDENVSPIVAEQIRQKRQDVLVESIHFWRDGALLGQPDSSVLSAAHADNRVVVTYDTQILSELYFWFAEARPFGGLLFIDDKTIASNDFGALVTSLIAFWNEHQAEDWDSRLAYLNRSG